MQRNWLRYLHIAAKSWTAWNNVKHHTSYIIHLLSHHTSSIKHQTSSDCTGGRISDAVRKNDNGCRFQYVSGALENNKPKDKDCEYVLQSQGIREHVCEILEGGKAAFIKREQKYGFRH